MRVKEAFANIRPNEFEAASWIPCWEFDGVVKITHNRASRATQQAAVPDGSVVAEEWQVRSRVQEVAATYRM